MKSAVIGRVDGTFDRVEPLSRVRPGEEFELREQIDVTGVKRTPDGVDIDEGRAASQALSERESVEFGADGLAVSTTEEPVTRHTKFVAVPGEFVGVDSGRGTFLFDLLSAVTDAEVTRSEFDLDAFAEAFPDATPWKVGFYGHDGPADNGVVHGESVLEDAVFGGPLADSKKNQLGLVFERDGTEYKMSITRSGYVEVYRPTDLTTAEFAAFVRENVLPYAE